MRRRLEILTTLAALLTVSLLATPAAAQQMDGDWQAHLLEGSQPTAQGGFGSVVDLEDDVAVVAAPQTGQDEQGRAHIFEQTDGEWRHAKRLTAPGSESEPTFGVDVAVSRGTILVGAHEMRHHDTRTAGAVYVYRRGDDGWERVNRLTASDFGPADLYGVSVDLVGDRAIVGTRQSPAAYVYVRDDESGEWNETRLTPPDDVDVGWFGASVAITGGTAAVGSPRGPFDTTEDPSPVFVYRQDGDDWQLDRQLLPTEYPDQYAFGSLVEMTRTHVVASVSGHNSGSEDFLISWDRRNESWAKREVRAPSGDGSGFGLDVSLDFSELFIGAADDGGLVHQFASSNDGWTHVDRIERPQSNASGFGSAVALDGNHLLVGAPGTERAGKEGAGIAYLLDSANFVGETGVDAGESDIGTIPSHDVGSIPGETGTGGGDTSAGSDASGGSDGTSGAGDAADSGADAGLPWANGSADSGGCNCRTPDGRPTPGFALVALLLVGLAGRND